MIINFLNIHRIIRFFLINIIIFSVVFFIYAEYRVQYVINLKFGILF